MVVRVRDVKFSVGYTQAAGFIKGRLCAVLLSGLASARESSDRARLRVKLFDLVIVSICDKKLAFVSHNPQRVLKAHVVAHAVNVAKIKEVAAHERHYVPVARLKIY